MQGGCANPLGNIEGAYRAWCAEVGMVREAGGWPEAEPHWTERHLQCIWYDDRLRPKALKTARGETVEVVEPGAWNLEAGPDFLDAEVRVGEARTPVQGDVEIHVRPGDWRRHLHGEDPRYARVVLHVTYFPGPREDSSLPGHWLRVSLQEGIEARRGFSFSDVDLGAYPHAVLPPTSRPCGEVLSALPPTRWTALLAAAGRHRVREKARRMAARLRTVGDRYQVFYEETLAMLGARKNCTPCRRLAGTVPRGREAGPLEVEALYARLLGAAGLLPDPNRLKMPEAQAFARALWDLWFRSGGGAEAEPEARQWVLSGIRPANHPQRRLAVAAMLFSAPRRVLDALDQISRSDPAAWARDCIRVFESVPPLPYWERRLRWDGPPTGEPVAGLGRNRTATLLANVVVPLILAEHPEQLALADALPSEDLGAPAREAAHRLFGRDHNPAFYARQGLLQQGLLAIHHDFCLRARGGCAACPLARHLREGVADAC